MNNELHSKGPMFLDYTTAGAVVFDGRPFGTGRTTADETCVRCRAEVPYGTECWMSPDLSEPPVFRVAVLCRSCGKQVQAEARTAVGLLCCNLIELPDFTAKECKGTMVAQGQEYVCTTCRARCGVQVHPDHARGSVEAPKPLTKAQRYEQERRARDAQIRELREQLASTRAELRQARRPADAVILLCDAHERLGHTSVSIAAVRNVLREGRFDENGGGDDE